MAVQPVSGIYVIVNVVNGKRYIGSAKLLGHRLYHHRLRLTNGRHHNRHLQKSWDKHGPAAFEFRIIIICEPRDLLLFEQRAIDSLKPEYNICPTAGSTLGRKFTEDAKRKIAAKAIGRKRDRESVERGAAKRRGVKLSPDHAAHLWEINTRLAIGTPKNGRQKIRRCIPAESTRSRQNTEQKFLRLSKI